jgi:hypothetical protein
MKASWLANLLPGATGDGKDAAAPDRLLMESLTRRITSLPLWGLPNPPPRGALEVVAVRDIAYRTDPQADTFRHRLDLFCPKGKKAFPVVVLVHGGGWMLGDNRACGLYSSVGQFLASQGTGVVLPNYRLSPWVKHPEHVKDVPAPWPGRASTSRSTAATRSGCTCSAIRPADTWSLCWRPTTPICGPRG